MQLLLTTATAAGTQPIYLPYDKAPVPFGDPLAATWTAATPTVVTVPGYLPTNGDAVALSIAGTSGFLTSLAGLTTISAQLNTTYYVSSASTDTFTLSTQKASAATPAGVLSMITTGMQLGGQNFVHLLSNQPDGPTLPFKPNNTVLAMNGGAAGIGSFGFSGPITILGAPDLNTVLATGTYGAPLGPNALGTTGWNVIGTIGFGTPKLVTLGYDWIVASGSTSTLILLQN
jgi:hypothetical protein